MPIRRRKYRSGKEVWQLDLVLADGKRFQRSFPTKLAAEMERDRVQGERRRYGDLALAMTPDARLRYAAAEARLAAAGVTLEQAVEWALAQAPVRQKALAMEALLDLFLDEKRRMKKRDAYLRHLSSSLGSFVLRCKLQPAPTVTRAQVKEWLFSHGWEPKTMHGYLTDLRTFFNWARREGYVTQRVCEGIEIPHVEPKEIAAFGPAQCRALLLTALRWEGEVWDRRAQRMTHGPRFQALLGYASLAVFEGVRPEELARSSREVIDLEHGTMIVEAAKAKTRQRRVVELCPASIAWLRRWMELCPAQRMIIPPNFQRLWEGLREKAGLKPPGALSLRGKKRPEPVGEPAPEWPPDVLRHTAATMHYALHRDAARLQALLGHERGEDTLFRHYRAVRLMDGRTVSRALAEEFYAILPPAD